jgi:hypothetical protein
VKNRFAERRKNCDKCRQQEIMSEDKEIRSEHTKGGEVTAERGNVIQLS